MKTLKDYLREDKSLPFTKKYISVIYNDETQENLRNYCKKYGFDLSKNYHGEDQAVRSFKFHTTIFYSTTSHKLKNKKSYYTPSEVYPESFDLFGDDKDVPVLLLKSEALDNIRMYYKETHQMNDEWPDYKPHISLSYSRFNIPDIHSIPLPDFDLIFDKIKIEDLEE